MKDPVVIRGILTNEEFNEFKQFCLQKGVDKNGVHAHWNRFLLGNTEMSDKLHERFKPIAQQIFEKEDLYPTFNSGGWSRGISHMDAHYDSNACTYSMNMSIYVKTVPWPIVIDGKKIILEEGDAVFSYGEDQLHGRSHMPDPENNEIINWFWFWVDKDHWFLDDTKTEQEKKNLMSFKTEELLEKKKNYLSLHGITEEEYLQ